MYVRYFVIICPWKRAEPFIWITLNPLHPRMLCAKFGWNWLSGSGEEDFWISSMYFRYFNIICPWRRVGTFIWTNLNPLYPRILCAKFGGKWPSGSGEEDKNVKSLQTDRRTDGQTTDDRWSEKLTWAFSSGELKTDSVALNVTLIFSINNQITKLQKYFTVWHNNPTTIQDKGLMSFFYFIACKCSNSCKRSTVEILSFI